MADQSDSKIVKEARPGKGAAGDQQAVQLAQPAGAAVHPPGTKDMSGGDVEQAKATIEEAKASEADTDMNTTSGYVVDSSGRVDNVAVEPEMYVEGDR
ncbi:MAG: hypothetical protein ACFB0E_04450 [Leptolyngbyaceae cyanobacterium]